MPSESSLFRVENINGLARAFAGLGTGLELWILLQIHDANNQVFIHRGMTLPLKASIADAIAEIEFPRKRAAGYKSAWGWTLMTALGAAGFAGVERTISMAPAWRGEHLIGVVGLLAPRGARQDFPQAHHLAWNVAMALKGVNRLETLQANHEAILELLANGSRPLLVATRLGAIIAGTPSGWALLQKAIYGDQRPPQMDAKIPVPDGLLKALKDNDNSASFPISKRIFAALAKLSKAPDSTAEATYIVDLRDSESLHTYSVEEATKSLTPAERETFAHILTGARNKEIAARLGISTHGVKHHVKACLRKLGAQDRLELIARYARATVPPLAAVHEVEPLGPVQGHFSFNLHHAYMTFRENEGHKIKKT